MNIEYTSRFERSYKKLPLYIQMLAEEREALFKNNPFDPRLRTHHLTGRLKAFWAFWIDHRYRIIFEFGKNATVYFHLAGDHNIYERLIRSFNGLR